MIAICYFIGAEYIGATRVAGVETIYGLVGLSLAFFVALEENAKKNARKERLITSGADIIYHHRECPSFPQTIARMNVIVVWGIVLPK